MNPSLTTSRAAAALCGIRSVAVILCGVSALLSISGCRGDRDGDPPREFFPDLDDQLKWRPQGQSEFFADNRSMRPKVSNTVAFGVTSFVPSEENEWSAPYAKKREQFLREGSAVYQGYGSDGREVSTIPVPVTMALLQQGQAKFNIYCAVCHGYYGDGKGQVGLQWATPVANFHDEKYKKADPTLPDSVIHLDGHMFRVAMLGLYDPTGAQKMPGYAHALSAEDGWAVVAYIRSLQASREGTMSEVPESQRSVLEKARAAAIAAQDAAAAAAAPAQTATPAPAPTPAPRPAPQPDLNGGAK